MQLVPALLGLPFHLVQVHFVLVQLVLEDRLSGGVVQRAYGLSLALLLENLGVVIEKVLHRFSVELPRHVSVFSR